MKYLMFIHENHRGPAPTMEALKPVMEGCAAWYAGMLERGQAHSCPMLQRPETAKWVRLQDGKPIITDGPFAETKDLLGGYVILEAKDLDEAAQLASGFPAMALGARVEVRPVFEDGKGCGG